ncbi:MAG: Ig-like domain-containing protein [Rhodoferax sp.]|uniref:Ig-like domain-containing protein n=1 Tax=Rhodoferax sp. TaxID=50421 RepID=UPI003BB09968
MNFIKCVAALGLTLALAACGGGGGSAGTPVTGSDSTPTPPAASASSPIAATSAVSDFVLLLSKNSINNSGTDSAQLTVTAVDANRNIVAGASVVVTTDQTSVFAPGGTSVTDASGKYVGTLTIGSDKTDRDVTLSVAINGIIKRTKVRVTGSRLSIQASPSAPTPNQSMTVAATLIDSAGNPIPEADVTLSGTVPGLQDVKLVTDLKGQVSKTLLAPSASGVFLISASGSGVNAADYSLNVFSSAVPVAIIPDGITPSLSASPNVVPVNSAGSTANQSTLRFLFLDNTNSPVKNVRVRFDDVTTGLANVGASISSGTSTLYTDGSGTVSVQYIPGQNSSPTNGVTVRVCYSANDFATSDCPKVVNVNLTTVGQALAVSVGDDNLLAVGTGGTYIKKFVVTVADSAGRAVVNAPVALAVDLTHYGKGSFSSPYRDSQDAPLSDNGLTVVPFGLTTAYPNLTINPDGTPVPPSDTTTSVQRVWCPNEDVNRNGNVDPGDNTNNSFDTNNQPTLEPRKADLIVSYADPAVTKTNTDGVLVIKVEYSQRFATWLAYRVIATTNVSGSQGMAERLFVTDYLEKDATNGSFFTPPYGVGSCVSPN